MYIVLSVSLEFMKVAAFGVHAVKFLMLLQRLSPAIIIFLIQRAWSWFQDVAVQSSEIVTTSRYVVPTSRVKVPAGRYVVPTGKDNVIVSAGRSKVIPAGRTILVLGWTYSAGREGISPLIKCTSAIRQLAYGVNASFLDEYMQISEISSRMSLDHFCQAVMEIYGPEFLRKPTVTDVEKLYRHHEETHGFPGMLGSLDCTDWEWFGCPYAFKGQYVRRDHGSNPFILLEAVASQDLWIWHAFFGVARSNNDINVLYQSPIFNDLIEHLAQNA
ncbi:ALP1-like protein isoform X1 [Tanacetum coccineum]|uniref:ALP1-like protein isoform X1 n=1 Tax=Tanacetum coccineum TaxID=301880 RepID=A0ABQ5BAL0_9ASTR